MENLARPLAHRGARPTSIRLLRGIGGVLLIVLGLLLLAALALPVGLLPIASAAPAPVWVLLGLADIALLIAAFRLAPRRWMAWAISLAVWALVAALAVGASQRFATTPPILGADGHPLPGSVASLEQVELNGSQQWITVRGRDTDRPVLLFLAGGPGGSQLAATRIVLSELERHFVVVNWDQPGAGKSYHAVPFDQLTPERAIADGLALTRQLRERFGQRQIYLVGESWGTALGVWMAQREPQHFAAVVSVAQMVDFAQTDIDCYNLALQIARERGDAKTAASLEAQGPPPYTGNVIDKEAPYLMYLTSAMDRNPAIHNPGYNTLGEIGGPEYGLYDKVSYVRGVLDSYNAMWPQLWGADLRTQATRLEVPIYILEGRHDINASPYLAEDYINRLDAPHKELIWFEHSGHNPWRNETVRFVEVMVGRVLGQAE